jgi:hypothetical protein
MIRPAFSVLLAVLLGSTLGGCGLEDLVKHRSTERSIIETGWVTPRVHLPEPIYCYRTLGTAMCYDEPREGEESRLVGHFGPRPY